MALDGIHLKQCVTLYLFALPMVLVHDFGWATVPVVTAIAFTFIGIEGIAEEIEMPFGLWALVHWDCFLKSLFIGNDARDLPLGLSIFSLYYLRYSCRCFDRAIL